MIDGILTAAGVFPADDPRAHNRKVFSAETYADLLAEIPTWVGSGEMMTAIGAKKSSFAFLESDGVLTPRTNAPKVIARWRLSDGLALLERLSAVAQPLSAEAGGWEGIQQAQKRKGVPVGQIIDRMLSGKLALGKDESAFGYNGFRVRVRGVNALAQNSRPSLRKRGLSPAPYRRRPSGVAWVCGMAVISTR
ncbi:hypothetical protein [Pseudogemmobacter humi]|nr:hypothetical protein [Pseudogemmobacter humi]